MMIKLSPFLKASRPGKRAEELQEVISIPEDHGEQAEAYRHEEMEKVIAMLSEVLLQVAGASPAAMVKMRELEHDISSAGTREDMSAARARLMAAADRLRAEAAAAAAGKRVHHETGAIDTVTGLPNAGFAAEAMAKIWDSRSSYYAVVYAVDRLETINARFGFKAGDQVLLILTQHIAQRMGPEDQLFRWRGTCLLNLMERHMAESLVAGEMVRVAGHRMEHAITIGGREVMVPISTSCSMLPLGEMDCVDDVVNALNDFALNRTSRPVTVAR